MENQAIFLLEFRRKFKPPKLFERHTVALIKTSVPDPNPDPPDPHVFGPPGSGSTSQRYGSGFGSFYHHAKIVRITLIPNIL